MFTKQLNRLTDFQAPLPSQPKLVLIYRPKGWKAELALGGWLVTYQNKCPAPGIEPGHGQPSQY